MQALPTRGCCRRPTWRCSTWALSALSVSLFFSHLTEEIFSWCGRYFCYCSDITCSYPVSRTFSSDQRLVYETVLEAQKQILGEEALFIPAIMQYAHRAIGCVGNFCSSHFNSCNEAWSVLAGHAPPHVARSADGEFLVYAFVFTNNFHIPHIPNYFPSSYCLFLLECLTLHNQGLKAGGVLVGDVDAMLAAGLGAVPPASLQPAASSSSPVPGVCALRSRSSHWCRHA